MPHECTACGRTFADGSKEMLSGCPDCGGTKFQFRPRTATRPSADLEESATDPSTDDGSQVTGREWPMHGDEPSDERRTRGRVGSRARGATSDEAGDSSAPGEAKGTSPAEPADDGSSTPPADPSPATDSGTTNDGIVVADEDPIPEDEEDSAQADARSGVAAPDEVAQGGAPDEADAVDSAPASDGDNETPDLSALRKELNDQFESIKIVSPGQYELNLMELYEREEHIISLREDGRYVIEVPETWRSG
jgi:hypothetical protein